VPPNKVDITDVNIYKSIGHNFVTVVVVAAFWVVYLLVVIWARWRDQKDISKVGACNIYFASKAVSSNTTLQCSLFESFHREQI